MKNLKLLQRTKSFRSPTMAVITSLIIFSLFTSLVTCPATEAEERAMIQNLLTDEVQDDVLTDEQLTKHLDLENGRHDQAVCLPDIYWNVEWRFYHDPGKKFWRWDYPVMWNTGYKPGKIRRFEHHEYHGLGIPKPGNPDYNDAIGLQPDTRLMDYGDFYAYLPDPYYKNSDFEADTGMPPKKDSLHPYNSEAVYQVCKNKKTGYQDVIDFPQCEPRPKKAKEGWQPYRKDSQSLLQSSTITGKLIKLNLWPPARTIKPLTRCSRLSNFEMQEFRAVRNKLKAEQDRKLPERQKEAIDYRTEEEKKADRAAARRKKAEDKAAKRREDERKEAERVEEAKRAAESEAVPGVQDPRKVRAEEQARLKKKDHDLNPWKTALERTARYTAPPMRWNHGKEPVMIGVPEDVFRPSEPKIFGQPPPPWLSDYNYLINTQQWLMYHQDVNNIIDSDYLADGLLMDTRVRHNEIYPIVTLDSSVAATKFAEQSAHEQEISARDHFTDSVHKMPFLLLRPSPRLVHSNAPADHFDGLVVPENHLPPAPYIPYLWYNNYLASPDNRGAENNYEFLGLVWSWVPTIQSRPGSLPWTGQIDRWSLHGLWPNLNWNKYGEPDDHGHRKPYYGPQHCYRDGQKEEIDGHADILKDWLNGNEGLKTKMKQLWRSAMRPDDEVPSLWFHEWKKHGTCGRWSSPWLDLTDEQKHGHTEAQQLVMMMKEYFRLALRLAEKYPIRIDKQTGVVATNPKIKKGNGYTAAELKRAIEDGLQLEQEKDEDHPRGPGQRHGPVALMCERKGDRLLLSDVMICLHPVTLRPVNCVKKDSKACTGEADMTGATAADLTGSAAANPPRIFLLNAKKV